MLKQVFTFLQSMHVHVLPYHEAITNSWLIVLHIILDDFRLMIDDVVHSCCI